MKNNLLMANKDRNFSGTLIFLLFALCILIISIVFFALSFHRPYLGVSISLSDNKWIVTSVDSNGSAIQAGMGIGDVPVEINGQPAQVFLEKYTKDKELRGPLIENLTVLNAQHELKSITLQESSPTQRTYFELATYIVVCFLFWIIGFYVFFKKPHNIAGRLLFLCSLFFGLALSANIAGERLISSAFWFAVVAFVVGPWVLVHFFVFLPEERTRIRKNPWVYLIYLPAFITLILYPIIGYADGQPVQWFRTLRLAVGGIGILTAAVVAIFNYFTSLYVKTRLQMKIVLIGCLIALIPFLFLYIVPETLSRNTPSPAGFSILFFIFIPLTMGYAVAAHKLMDIDFFIRRGVIYTLVTLIMAAILSIAIFTALKYPGSLDFSEEILLAIGLGAIATLLFGPLKKGIEVLIDKIFYKDRYDYRQIIEILSNSLKSINDLNDISRVVVGTITKTLNLAGACLLVIVDDSFKVSAAQGIFYGAAYQNKLKTLIPKDDQNLMFPNAASNLDMNLTFLVPFTFENKIVGVLCLSNKVSSQKYSSDDMFLIQGIASISAIALHSAMLIHDVSIKNTFISVASHELRTPLTAIMGYAELLLRHEQSDTNKKWLQNILDNGQKITNMANDLLNVSRIQSGKLTFKIERVRLSVVLSEQIEMMRELSNKHEFILDIDPGVFYVSIDRDKFGEVIANLLDNAVKYSPNGGHVSVSAHNNSSQKNVVVSVKDEGIGISPEDVESLFTTFNRIQRPEVQGVRGSGLGLFITKEWIEAMGGKIWIESELNKGSTFFITIPSQ